MVRIFILLHTCETEFCLVMAIDPQSTLSRLDESITWLAFIADHYSIILDECWDPWLVLVDAETKTIIVSSGQMPRSTKLVFVDLSQQKDIITHSIAFVWPNKKARIEEGESPGSSSELARGSSSLRYCSFSHQWAELFTVSVNECYADWFVRDNRPSPCIWIRIWISLLHFLSLESFHLSCNFPWE